jgi:hypothetical protein
MSSAGNSQTNTGRMMTGALRPKRFTKAAIGLVAINVIAATMHFVYECELLGYQGPLREFVLETNLLCGFVFLFPAVGLLFAESTSREYLKTYELIWWIYDLVVVSVVWTSVTTLGMVQDSLHFSLPFSDSVVLVFTASAAVVLAINEFRDRKKSVAGPGRRLSLPLAILILLNCGFGAMRLLSVATLQSNGFVYRDFIQVCNLFVVFVFLYSAAVLSWGAPLHKKWMLKYQVFWWPVNAIVLSMFGGPAIYSFSCPLSESAIQMWASIVGFLLCVWNLPSSKCFLRVSSGSVSISPEECANGDSWKMV